MQSTTSFHRRIQHSFLQQKRFYDEQCGPLFQSLHPYTLDWILSPKLSPLVKSREDGKVFATMRSALEYHNNTFKNTTALRKGGVLTSVTSTLNLGATTSDTVARNGSKKGKKISKKSENSKKTAADITVAPTTSVVVDPFLPVVGDDPHTLIAGLKWLSNAQHRLEKSRFNSFTHTNYEFEVGDVVYQKQLGQVGVVADRLPVCFESDEWVEGQLDSSTDIRLTYPWYFILVASHRDLPVDMTRYGSALSHTRATRKMSIGFHSLLPVYFEGYDHQRGVYIPRKDKSAFARNSLAHMARAQQISIGSIMGTVQPRKIEEES